MWKNEKFSLTKKIFRQINSLVTYFVKSLLSRKFCQNCVRERIPIISTMWAVTFNCDILVFCIWFHEKKNLTSFFKVSTFIYVSGLHCGHIILLDEQRSDFRTQKVFRTIPSVSAWTSISCVNAIHCNSKIFYPLHC